MRTNDRDTADEEATAGRPSSRDGEPSGTAATAGTGTGDGPRPGTDRSVAADRRRFLKALSAPPLAAAVAGCERLGPGSDATGADLRDLEPGDTTGYRGAFRFGDAYRMRVTRAADGTTTTTGRFDGDDRYLRVERAGTVIESYIVDGDGYVVVDGACTSYPDVTASLEGVVSVSGTAGETANEPELSVVDTTTLDGREVFVLALPSGELGNGGRDGGRNGDPDGQDRTGETGHGTLTYYVDAGTRYPRRIETDTTVVDYRSWGDVEPVTVPDLGCDPAE